jgi:DNA-binding XRE family transcriptional regulator
VWDVDATQPTAERGVNATHDLVPGKLNAELFDRRCEALGLLTEVAKAEFVGVHRVTLHRYRSDDLKPRLEVAMRFCERLDLPINELWGAA